MISWSGSVTGIKESMYVEWKLSRPLNIMPALYWYEVAKVLFALHCRRLPRSTITSCNVVVVRGNSKIKDLIGGRKNTRPFLGSKKGMHWPSFRLSLLMQSYFQIKTADACGQAPMGVGSIHGQNFQGIPHWIGMSLSPQQHGTKLPDSFHGWPYNALQG
ncbi:hypothetical protein L207DRAFT_194224 [Hyaloscypha variabilis F]|uniref:Uncharacterized protein n=1 Tax=Hyaloscypha variabilis (strain UAMH 11265 / GT02V1 / F) TaxID=1149755 RepID=A0A2J6QYD4_HYAVF|nr:hypothetical protein L207DRAFT_194224 [Hyaloscypha variabilis F]